MKKQPKKLSINKHTISRLHNTSNIFGRGVDTNTGDNVPEEDYTKFNTCITGTDNDPRQSSIKCTGLSAK